MSVKLKVCGMRDKENIKALLSEVKPDFIGLITYGKSPRYMLNSLNDTSFIEGAKKVGVFVNESKEMVLETIEKYKLDAVQLHGGESPDYCRQFKSEHVLVIKVFSVFDELPVDKMTAYLDVVDYFLLDTKTPKHGGSGKKFNWSILKDYHFDIPFFLSGGISSEDVASIQSLDIPQLYALDINSKFELEPGLKNIELIKEFKNNLV